MTVKGQDERELDVWFALRALEQAADGLLELAPADPERPELWVVYREHRQLLHAPVVELGKALRAALPDPSAGPRLSLADRVWAAILIHYDERELAAADQRPAGPRAPLLQTEYFDLFDGGETFFVYLMDALRAPGTPSLALQLFLFCLRADFCGRYLEVGDLERKELQAELCRRVASDGAPGPLAATMPPVEPIPGVGFAFHVYALALVFVVGFWFALESMAETHQASRGALTCVDE